MNLAPQNFQHNNHRAVFITLMFLWTIIQLSPAASMPQPVGIINISQDYLMGWNQGQIANETYFNRTTGLIQIANKLNRTNDIRYEFGYARKTGSTYTYLEITTLPDTESYSTDFSTGYYASSSKNISAGGNWVYLARNNSQRTYDDYVQVDYTLQSRNAILGNFYFASILSQIDIGMDNHYEMSVLTLANGSDVFVWNETGTKVFDNISRIQIHGMPGSYSFDLQFPGGVVAQYNHSSSSVNGDWTFLKPIGTIPAMTKFTITHYWIDAVCIIVCIPGCPISTSITPISNRYINRSKEVTIGCQWYTLGIGCSGSPCHFSGCYLQLTHNVSKNTFRDLARFGDYTTNVNISQTTLCANSTSCYIDANAIPQNSFVRWGVLGGNLPGILREDNLRCNIDVVLGNTSRYSSGTISVFVNYTIVKNVTAWKPIDHSIITTTLITFECNWTETQPLNISLFIDGIYYGNATVGSAPLWTLRNLSKSVQINNTGVYVWGCKACYAGGECVWSDTLWGIGGNKTFTYIGNPSLTLISPTNNTEFTGYQNVTFNATWQVERPDNITLYIDEQPNLTVTAGINLTTSRYFDYYALHYWTARACYKDYCLYSQNGTLEFTIQAPGILEEIASLFKRIDEMDREEEINSVWVLGSIALFSLIITEILRRRRELASLAGKPPVG